jgi:hypothetical protein
MVLIKASCFFGWLEDVRRDEEIRKEEKTFGGTKSPKP